MTHNRLLIVEDDKSYRTAMATSMESRGFVVATAPNGSAAFAWLEKNECDLVLLDLKLPDMSGLDVLGKVLEEVPMLEVVILTGHGTIDTAIDAIRMGAYHYLTKPCPADEVELTLHKAQERLTLRRRTHLLEDALRSPDAGKDFVGRSAAFQSVLHRIERVSHTDSSVLITGETGVGKELVAKLIHNRSARRDHLFVVVDCAGLHENLLQSELFGHEKGAYTGATRQKHGLFEVADQGTIFLDEIGDIPPSLQVKLLRVLETNSFRRLGGTKEISVDVRVLAATNRNLLEMVAQKHFREDLYYRLNAICIHVPPLRERPDDIECLVAHFVDRFNVRFGQDKFFGPEATQAMREYGWPGNVRQLSNVVEQSVVLSEQSRIDAAHLPTELQTRKRHGQASQFGANLIPLEQVERQYIEFVLEQLEGHRTKAAQALGIGERSLYRRLKTYGIE